MQLDVPAAAAAVRTEVAAVTHQFALYVRSRVCLGCGKELSSEERKLRVEYCSQECNTAWSEANPLPVVEVKE